MTHPRPDLGPHEPLRPVRIVPIVADTPPKDAAEAEEDGSMRPVAGPSGFASDAAPAHASSIPWERRPLTRHAIVGWTIGSMIAMVLVGTTVAAGLARSASHAEPAVAPHGAEQADLTASPQAGDAPPAIPPSASAESKPAIPLNTLPRVHAKKAKSSSTVHHGAQVAVSKKPASHR